MIMRDQILAADDKPREAVTIPEWGNLTLYVRTLSGRERDQLEQWIIGPAGTRNLSNIRARLAVLTLTDENGARIFADDDETLLGDKSAAALQRIFDVASRLNRLTAADVEELAKN